jgi:hypothetical protein
MVRGRFDINCPGAMVYRFRAKVAPDLYHALQGSSSGPATLRITEIAWDANGGAGQAARSPSRGSTQLVGPGSSSDGRIRPADS